jgi:hypothetical protein
MQRSQWACLSIVISLGAGLLALAIGSTVVAALGKDVPAALSTPLLVIASGLAGAAGFAPFVIQPRPLPPLPDGASPPKS